MTSKKVILLFVTLCFVGIWANPSGGLVRKSRRVNIPFLGIGPLCQGCPPHFCDDDPAIIFGYCCGCARFFDYLPVQCSVAVRCPLNNYDVCQDYEYMLHCCCN